jgi:ankyrin repeat protein
VCSFILEHEPDLLNRPNASKDAPIHISCQNGHADAVKVLLAAGADTRKRTSHGFGPLHLAARQGHVAVRIAF